MTSFLILIFFSACGGPKTVHGKLAYGIINSYSRQMEKIQGFQTIGIGGSMLGDIQVLAITFISKQKIDLTKARELFVETAQGLLDQVNANEQIRPYLHDYPFTVRNLKLIIGFSDQKIGFYQDGYIASVMVVNDKISYAIFDPETDQLKKIYDEPYEEALRIVQEECPFPS